MTDRNPGLNQGHSSVTLRDVSLYIQLTSRVSCWCLAGWTGRSSLTTTALLIVLCEDLLLYVTVTEERARRLLDPADVPWVGFAAQPRCRMRGGRRKAHNLHSKTGRWWKAPHGLEIHLWPMECFTYLSGNEAAEMFVKRGQLAKKNCDWMNSLDLWLEVFTVLEVSPALMMQDHVVVTYNLKSVDRVVVLTLPDTLCL